MKWESSLKGACTVLLYKVHYRERILPDSFSEWKSVTVNRHATRHTLHLDCGKLYELTVTFVNSH